MNRDEALRVLDQIDDVQDFREQGEQDQEPGSGQAGDRRDGRLYVYTSKIRTAIRVALATDRPLLIRGLPGCGKSSLAYNLAHILGWRYYEFVITSRTRARDLLWQFDAVRRLADAQNGRGPFADDAPKDPLGEPFYHRYVQPGVLWWILEPESAAWRGLDPVNRALIPQEQQAFFQACDPATGLGRENAGAILLVDEIDKADPDFGNDLLVPFGSYRFTVEETRSTIQYKPEPDNGFLMVITTNDERELPAAFMRRCIVLDMKPADETRLRDIAEQTLGQEPTRAHFNTVYQKISASQKGEVSIPEFLDAMAACIRLAANGEIYDEIISHTVWKRKR